MKLSECFIKKRNLKVVKNLPPWSEAEGCAEVQEREFDKFFNLVSDLGNPLRFDFAIFDNNKLILLIEYDGEQHFKWLKGWQTKEEFEKLQYHDQLKNTYCKNNNIPLLRIPYYDFDNIDDILCKYLKY